MSLRAQAGLEYLMTYGWALVLIVTVVAVLFFVFSPTASTTRFSSSNPTKILLRTSNVSGTSAEIQLQNATGGKIEITAIAPTNYSNCTINGGTSSISVGGGSIMKLNCTALSDNKGSIKIDYIDYAGMQKSVTINASGTSGSTGSPGGGCGNSVCSLGEACSADCFAETYCSDGINNDQDAGGTDCSDLDCFSDPSCTPASLSAGYLFDEGSGLIAADSSGNGNNGNISGASWQTSGCPQGYCLYFNGTGDRIQISNSPTLNLADDLALSALIKLDNLSAENPIIATIKGGGPPTYEGYRFWVNSSGNLVLRLGNSSSYATATCNSCALSPGVWYNVAVSNDSTNGTRFYVNGSLKQSFPFYNWTDSGVPVYIGYNPESVAYFKGYIDSVRIYNAPIN